MKNLKFVSIYPKVPVLCIINKIDLSNQADLTASEAEITRLTAELATSKKETADLTQQLAASQAELATEPGDFTKNEEIEEFFNEA